MAPNWLPGDLRPVPFEPAADEANRTERVNVYMARQAQLMYYGRRLNTIIQSRSWDLIHAWQEPYVVAGAQIGWYARRQPVVYYTFQNLAKRYPPPFNWLENWTINRSAGWIAAGNSVEQTLLPRPGYAKKPHTVISLGIDTQVFQPDPQARKAIRDRLSFADGPPVIGFLGRFVPEKGLALLQQVLDQLTTPWRALLVGSGPLEQQLQHWAQRHGDQVRVVTGVKHHEVPGYLNAMDLLVAPSQTTTHWREQFGRMLIEAFACGLPVIASDSGEIPHVVGDAGVIVPEKDVNAWVKNLTELLNAPERRQELAQRGLHRARQKFSWCLIAQQHWNFFDELQEQSSQKKH